MAKKKQKFYVVWLGFSPGIYYSWEACQEQISGYPGAMYKSFEDEKLAMQAYRDAPNDHIGQDAKPQPKTIDPNAPKPIAQSISVDGAWNSRTGDIEYQGVLTHSREKIFHAGPFKDGTNNVAEFLAVVHAIGYCQKNNLDLPIYSDSITAMAWVRKKQIGSTLAPTPNNAKLFELMKRALHFLMDHQSKNPILKWETDIWGENPADFGRK
jgi:ribonuclease HI